MTTLGFIGNIGAIEWVVIGVVALLLFGGRRLPEFGRSLGSMIVEFKKGLAGIEESVEKAGTAEAGPKSGAAEAGPKSGAASGGQIGTDAKTSINSKSQEQSPSNQG